MHTEGCSYNQIAMSRSALSTIIDKGIKPYPSFGQHPFVKRFLKGIFEMKPVLPKYPFVWDVSKLLEYFRKGDDPCASSFSVLGKKLAILLTILSGGQRAQTIFSIDVLDIKIVGGNCVIPIYDTLKQTRPGHHLEPLKFSVYLKEPKLCVITILKEYLKKTTGLRTHSKLFISSQKPHQPVSKDTISRWCKQTMEYAGIDTTLFTSHSSRSAATSMLFQKGASISLICKSAGWSNEKVFRRHYQKKIIENDENDVMSHLLN